MPEPGEPEIKKVNIKILKASSITGRCFLSVSTIIYRWYLSP
jgi:hypothetical protein